MLLVSIVVSESTFPRVVSFALDRRNNNDTSDGDDQLKEAKANAKWTVLSENIKNYIRSLNFKYRVRLREKEVTYIPVNKLAKFVEEHTIKVTDKKGDTSTITASRFLIVVGGRPTPLECEGGDLAISSDDIFFS
jgi:thioredoxin reductase (NADPH)